MRLGCALGALPECASLRFLETRVRPTLSAGERFARDGGEWDRESAKALTAYGVCQPRREAWN